MTQASDMNYTVRGMSCEHCVRSVTEEVAEVDGVDAVTIEHDVPVRTEAVQ